MNIDERREKCDERQREMNNEEEDSLIESSVGLREVNQLMKVFFLRWVPFSVLSTHSEGHPREPWIDFYSSNFISVLRWDSFIYDFLF